MILSDSKMNINKSANESRLLLQNMCFLNKNSLAQYMEVLWLEYLSQIIILKKFIYWEKFLGLVVFKIVHLIILALGKLNFQVVIDCKITNSDMTRG